MNIADGISNSNQRAEFYNVFAACFYLPEASLFDEQGTIMQVVHNISSLSDELADELQKMIEVAAQSDIEELRVEYSRLFVGPFTLPCPPYGSVYLEQDRRVMGDTTLEVIELYKQEGLEIDKSFQDLPDHIAVELEFMYYLLYNQVQAETGSNNQKANSLQEKQQHFFTKFIFPWIPEFCSQVKKSAQNDYFYHLAEALRIFINIEKERLLEGSSG